MQVALIGLGLIGGSVARAARAAGTGPIVAWTPGGQGPRDALAAGAIDVAAGTLDEAVAGSDIVVLAAPPLACLELLGTIAERRQLAPGAVVTDVASTKAAIVARAAALGIPFVGGHPMAGAETSGFGAASADLFQGRTWVVVAGPTSPAGGVERIEELARACGARPLRLDAETHDRAVAAISHVPLVIAAALAEAIAGPPGPTEPPGGAHDRSVAAALAASGWASATRLALGAPAMGAGIAATNGPAIADGLRAVRAAIDAWIVLLDRPRPDPDVLEARFEAAREWLVAGRGTAET